MRRVIPQKGTPLVPEALTGEPGVGVDLAPPFKAQDAVTAWLFDLNRKGMRPGLVRIQGLLRDLGNPQDRLRTLVVAGTNGKGSTTRILARLLRAQGFKVATYTSPHLLSVTERIEINELPVDPEFFSARVQAIQPLVEKHEASWFETLTALAVQIASDEEVDFLCCETGLGGRLDATNALPALAVLLTGIGLDHQHILGESLQEICTEKLGLLKAGTPFFCNVQGELKAQAFAAAVTAKAPCYFVDELAQWRESDPQAPGTMDLVLRDQVLKKLPAGLGFFAHQNLALALLTLTELSHQIQENLLPADLSAALGNLFLPGRYQLLLQHPDWYLDTAHNAQALTAALENFSSMPSSGRRVLLLGGMRDKVWDDEVAGFVRRMDEVVLTPISLPRSRTADELQAVVSHWSDENGQNSWTVAEDLGGALAYLANHLEPQDKVLVTGSCFLVAETLHRLGISDLESTRQSREARPVLERVRVGSAAKKEV